MTESFNLPLENKVTFKKIPCPLVGDASIPVVINPMSKYFVSLALCRHAEQSYCDPRAPYNCTLLNKS